MSHPNIYFDFLILCEEKKAFIQQYSAHISPSLLALFVVIAMKHDQGEPMTISETMALEQMASSASLHKRIDDLREAGMIHAVCKGPNKRNKYLMPSEKGDMYLKFMGQLLHASHEVKK